MTARYFHDEPQGAEPAREIAADMRVCWLNENMPGVIVGPAPEGPWNWEIKLDDGGSVLAYTHEVILP